VVARAGRPTDEELRNGTESESPTTRKEDEKIKPQDKQVEADELEKDDLEDVSGGQVSPVLPGDKNCGC